MNSNRRILFGQYRPGDSFFHRRDTRAIFLPSVLAITLVIFSDSALFYISLCTLYLFLVLMSGASKGDIVRNIKPIILFVAVTFVYHILFTGREGEIAFRLIGFSVSEQALISGSRFSLRFLLFFLVAFWIGVVSAPTDIARSFTQLLSPLRKLRLPVDDIGLILFIAMRFVPILYEEFQSLKFAQMARGATFEGRWHQRIRKSTALLIPVFLSALNRADSLALALQVRGYRPGAARSWYQSESFSLKDGLFAAGMAIILVSLYLVLG